MHVLVSGSTGLVGRALVAHLERGGNTVTPLVRPETDAAGVEWSPDEGTVDTEGLSRADAVVHLAGESIDQRWSGGTKRRIRESRVRGTRLLAGALADLAEPPDVLVSASAVGYYGDRGDEWLTEAAGPGDLFISEVCEAWEAATEPAAAAGIRVVTLRTGIVLSTDGGALARMLPVFRLGLGGHLGSGEQYMSWVTREDAARAVGHLLAASDVAGPVNLCAPTPVTNREFTDTLGDVLGRPTLFWVPGVGVRLLYGQMGEELLLASDRMRPEKLAESGFEWRYPDLEPALEHVLGE
jgi:hypothetical protein